MAYFDTYKIFHYLNRNYDSINELQQSQKLSDLEFDIDDSKTSNLDGGKLNSSDDFENVETEEYTDLLLPKIVNNYSSNNITLNSTDQEIEKDINNTIEQNMSLKTLEEIYGKRNEDTTLKDNENEKEIEEDNKNETLTQEGGRKSINESEDQETTNESGGNDREVDYYNCNEYNIQQVDDDEDDDDDEIDDEDDYEMNEYFDDIEAINDKDVQENVKEMELSPEISEIDNIYSTTIDIDNSENSELADNADLEGKADICSLNLEKIEPSISESNENQQGGESVTKIIENLGDNDEEAYIKGCKSSGLSGGYTKVNSLKFGFYPYNK